MGDGGGGGGGHHCHVVDLSDPLSMRIIIQTLMVLAKMMSCRYRMSTVAAVILVEWITSVKAQGMNFTSQLALLNVILPCQVLLCPI